jgi:Ran GTPase-activating protein (RanGAP) involved in mRNA processing and transport
MLNSKQNKAALFPNLRVFKCRSCSISDLVHSFADLLSCMGNLELLDLGENYFSESYLFLLLEKISGFMRLFELLLDSVLLSAPLSMAGAVNVRFPKNLQRVRLSRNNFSPECLELLKRGLPLRCQVE